MSTNKDIEIPIEATSRKQRALAELKRRSLIVAILFGAALLFTGAAFLFLREPKVETTAQQEPEGYLNGYRYVDLGLSVKWAELSVGADEENPVGDLFAWGEIVSKEEFTLENYNAPSEKMHAIERKRHHDAATDSYGRGWRMPTRDEVVELVEKCTWEPVTSEERCGYIVTGSNGNSIFIASIDATTPTAALWSSYAADDRAFSYALKVTVEASEVVEHPAFMGLQVRGVTR